MGIDLYRRKDLYRREETPVWIPAGKLSRSGASAQGSGKFLGVDEDWIRGVSYEYTGREPPTKRRTGPYGRI